MSSSTSSSDSAPREWGRWLATFLGALCVGAAVVFAIVIAVDPYDSGRFGFFGIKGVIDEVPRTAQASRASDPDFDSAVIGNSTGQILSPSNLSRLTGKRFVQLTIFLTGPGEQLAILDFFARNHPRIGALVIATDVTWCTRDPALPVKAPFPYWLYGKSTFVYLGRLFSERALGRVWRRVLIATGRRRRSDPEGYLDYGAWMSQDFHPDTTVEDHSPDVGGGEVSTYFPGVARLKDFVKRLPADVPVVVLAPPAFFTRVPRPGSVLDADIKACHTALRDVVAGRPHSNFIDYFRDDATTRDRMNFHDHVHYRAPLARKIEQDIAESIRLGDKAVVGF